MISQACLITYLRIGVELRATARLQFRDSSLVCNITMLAWHLSFCVQTLCVCVCLCVCACVSVCVCACVYRSDNPAL